MSTTIASSLLSTMAGERMGLFAVTTPIRLTAAVRHARWDLAVLTELAEPGRIHLVATRDKFGQVLDFRCLDASPTATLALGRAGEDLQGCSLKRVLSDFPMGAAVFSACEAAYLQQLPKVASVEGKDGLTLHAISPQQWGVSIELTNSRAVGRLLPARRAVHRLEKKDSHRNNSRMREVVE